MRTPHVDARWLALPLVFAALSCGGSDKSSSITPPKPPNPQPPAVASITVTGPTDSLTVGQTGQFSAVLKDASGNTITGPTVTWSSSDTTIAVVSSTGLVTAIAAGGAKVSAAAGGQTGSASLGVKGFPLLAPIALVPTHTIGKDTLPSGNTAQGGQGAPVDGLTCGVPVQTYHVHAHLSLFINGEQIAVPLGVGTEVPFVQDNYAVAAHCFYNLHTHDRTGIIHIEAAQKGTFTLGQFFDVWGEPLTATSVLGLQAPVVFFVDGKLFMGDPRTIELVDHRQITIEVGTPIVAPPVYTFPAVA